MNRYLAIQEEVFNNLESYCFNNKKLHGYTHLFGVATVSIMLAPKFDLDPEICGVIGLLHDYAEFKNNTSFDHANRSSTLANIILSKNGQFSYSEILTITTAIKNHSNKDRIDDRYSEFIKLCDILHSYLNEPDKILSSNHNHYLEIARKKNII